MAKVGTAEYDVEISRAKVQAEVDAASRQIERGLGDSAKRAGTEFSNAARVAVAGFAGAASARFFGDAIQAASNLAEQQSKSNVVFGEAAAQVNAFAESAAKSFGQSERAALEATGTFGNLFVSVGVGQQQAADMSVTLAKLAADLASFNNVPIEDVFTALRAGLVGEQEPLRRLGVNLNEATLKAKAMALGLSDGKGVLDANAKAQAAYALILEQTGTAQGDFARTSDSLANQQRILSAEWEESKAQLGEGLIPAAKLAVGVFGDFASIVSKVPAPVLATGAAVGGLTLGVGLLAPVVKSGVESLREFAALVGRRVTTTAASTAAINAETAALSANTAAQNANNAAAASGAAQTGRLGTSLVGAGVAAGVLAKGSVLAAAGLAAFTITNKAGDFLSQAAVDAEALAEALANVGESGASATQILAEFGGNEAFAQLVIDANKINSIGEALKGLLDGGIKAGDKSTAQEVRKAQEELAKLDEKLTDLYNTDPQAALTAYGQITKALVAQGVPVQDLVAKLPTFIDLVEQGGDAQTAAATSTEAATAAYQEQFDALQEQFDLQRGLVDARENTAEAVRDLAEAEAAAKGNSDEYRQAQEAIADAESGVADAVAELADARREAAGDSDAYRDAQRGVADAERAVADAQRSTAQAQRDLTQARKDAAEQLEDLALAAEGAALAEERAAIRLEETKAALADVKNDPRSTSAEKRGAELAIREAELALKEAQDRNEDSAAELAAANAKGIEGSDAVVAAKERVQEAIRAEQDARVRLGDATRRVSQVIVAAQERVVEAQQRVRDSEKRLAEANEAAAEVIEDAKERHRDAVKRVEDAIFDQADAERDLAAATGDAIDSTDVYLESLDKLSKFLAPDHPLRRGLNDYIQDLRDLQRISLPQTGSGYGVTGTIGAPGPAMGPPSPPGPRSNVTVNVTTDANPKEIADALMWD